MYTYLHTLNRGIHPLTRAAFGLSTRPEALGRIHECPNISYVKAPFTIHVSKYVGICRYICMDVCRYVFELSALPLSSGVFQ